MNLTELTLSELKELREAVSQEMLKRFGFEAKPVQLVDVATELQEALDRHSKLEQEAFEKIDAVRDQRFKEYQRQLENLDDDRPHR